LGHSGERYPPVSAGETTRYNPWEAVRDSSGEGRQQGQQQPRFVERPKRHYQAESLPQYQAPQNYLYTQIPPWGGQGVSGHNPHYPGMGHLSHPGLGYPGFPGMGYPSYPGLGYTGFPGLGYPGLGNTGFPGLGYPGLGNTGFPGLGYPGLGNTVFPGFGYPGLGYPGLLNPGGWPGPTPWSGMPW
jgi:hypothetical protein